MSEQDSSTAADVGELMRAIYATHPGISVEVGIRPNWNPDRPERRHAYVTVLNLPAHLANLRSETDWPNQVYTSPAPNICGVHLNANRYEDDDVAAVLTTALEFITTHSEVAS